MTTTEPHNDENQKIIWCLSHRPLCQTCTLVTLQMMTKRLLFKDNVIPKVALLLKFESKLLLIPRSKQDVQPQKNSVSNNTLTGRLWRLHGRTISLYILIQAPQPPKNRLSALSTPNLMHNKLIPPDVMHTYKTNVPMETCQTAGQQAEKAKKENDHSSPPSQSQHQIYLIC